MSAAAARVRRGHGQSDGCGRRPAAWREHREPVRAAARRQAAHGFLRFSTRMCLPCTCVLGSSAGLWEEGWPPGVQEGCLSPPSRPLTSRNKEGALVIRDAGIGPSKRLYARTAVRSLDPSACVLAATAKGGGGGQVPPAVTPSDPKAQDLLPPLPAATHAPGTSGTGPLMAFLSTWRTLREPGRRAARERRRPGACVRGYAAASPSLELRAHYAPNAS